PSFPRASVDNSVLNTCNDREPDHRRSPRSPEPWRWSPTSDAAWLMGRHRDPERGLPGEPDLAEDCLVVGAVGLQVDVVVVHALYQVVARFAPPADERRGGETHVHVARQLLRVLLDVRLEHVTIEPTTVDARDPALLTVRRLDRDLLPDEPDLDIG